MTPKLTVTETPTDEIIAQAVQPVQFKDGRGRAITLKKPGVLAQFRLVKLLGDAAQNQTYMAMLFPLLYVAEIDGDAQFFPQSEAEIEALIQRLDEDGVGAVMVKVQEVFGAQDPEAAKSEVRK